MSKTATTKDRSRGWASAEDVERGLWAVARANGNTYRAARELQERGYSFSRSRLENWKNRDHPERYKEIEAQVQALVRRQMEKEAERLVRLRVRESVREAVLAGE